MLTIEKSFKEYRFKLKAQTGGTLLHSILFPKEQDLKKTLGHFCGNGKKAIPKIERKTNTNGDFLFTIKDEKGMVIAHSDHYSSEAGMENGIRNVLNTMAAIKELPQL